MAAPFRNVVIIDCTDRPYNPDSAEGSGLGGIQFAVLNLSAALRARGHAVTVLNNTPEEKVFGGVLWKNRASPPLAVAQPENTVFISCNDPGLFAPYAGAIENGAKAFLWAHNALGLKRFLRGGRWRSYRRFRPRGIFLSRDALENAGFYYPFSGKTVIPHFLHEDFTSGEAAVRARAAMEPLGPKAVFMSQPHRGLAKTVRLWRDHVRPACPGASLHVYCDRQAAHKAAGMTGDDLARAGIVLEGRKKREDLIRAIGGSRAMFYPGSKDETFCYAAAEALALGIPVVTQGIGSLKDRVRDGVDGLVRPGNKDFAAALVRVMQDDALWRELRKNAVEAQETLSKDAVIGLWERAFGEG